MFADELWAKSPPTDPAQQEGCPLLPHLLDVAAVATCLLDAVPCPVELPMAAAWIVALVDLSDRADNIAGSGEGGIKPVPRTIAQPD